MKWFYSPVACRVLPDNSAAMLPLNVFSMCKVGFHPSPMFDFGRSPTCTR